MRSMDYVVKVPGNRPLALHLARLFSTGFRPGNLLGRITERPRDQARALPQWLGRGIGLHWAIKDEKLYQDTAGR
jgi:hypothetical protein